MNHESISRQHQEHTFTSHDGCKLFYRYWPAQTEKPVGAIVLFHRGHEHSLRQEHVVDELNLPNYACFAWDARGHGQSEGERGHSPGMAASIKDVQAFIDHISSTYGIAVEDMAVVGQSVGAVLAATWVHDYVPKIRCMILASPAFKIKLYVPFARPGLKMLHTLRGNFFVNSYVKAKFLTHDPDRIASYETDPLITRPISVNMLLDVYDTSDRIVEDAGSIVVPTQLLISGSDWVVHHRPQHLFYEHLGSWTKERHVLPGFYHDTLGEKDRSGAIRKMRTFIQARFAEPVTVPVLLDADKTGFTRHEADTLATPLSPFSLRGLYWMFARFIIKFGGLWSEGIRLGQQTGFDSGSTLDYVYRNQPRGFTALGRFVDKMYLNAVGWRGIRQRKIHIEQLLQQALRSLHDSGKPIHILDIAAGHGRYILEALEKSEMKPDSIQLRDYSGLNVEQGQALIAEKDLTDVARFSIGDAFDSDNFKLINPKPSLSVVSGLYELFADNAMVLRSLSNLAAITEPGGYLIYTGQPWHPQLETIARTLTSHRGGNAWIMRRRTQIEMDQLVEAAGFKKIDQRIDGDGIFTVSLAVRTGAS